MVVGGVWQNLLFSERFCRKISEPQQIYLKLDEVPGAGRDKAKLGNCNIRSGMNFLVSNETKQYENRGAG